MRVCGYIGELGVKVNTLMVNALVDMYRNAVLLILQSGFLMNVERKTWLFAIQ